VAEVIDEARRPAVGAKELTADSTLSRRDKGVARAKAAGVGDDGETVEWTLALRNTHLKAACLKDIQACTGVASAFRKALRRGGINIKPTDVVSVVDVAMGNFKDDILVVLHVRVLEIRAHITRQLLRQITERTIRDGELGRLLREELTGNSGTWHHGVIEPGTMKVGLLDGETEVWPSVQASTTQSKPSIETVGDSKTKVSEGGGGMGGGGLLAMFFLMTGISVAGCQTGAKLVPKLREAQLWLRRRRPPRKRLPPGPPRRPDWCRRAYTLDGDDDDSDTSDQEFTRPPHLSEHPDSDHAIL